jgi:excisionase family DNA binding protein
MVQGFYTLEEAARILGTSPEELNRMAQKRELRAFADRGTWRFRSQDIDELARQRGTAEAAPPPPATVPSSPGRTKTPMPKTPMPKPAESAMDDEIFGFSLSDETSDYSKDVVLEKPPAASTRKKTSGLKSPPPPSDEGELRLVPDDLNLEGDELRLTDETPPASAKRSSGVKQDQPVQPSGRRRSGLHPSQRRDSEVKLGGPDEDEVNLGFDSSVKFKDDDSMVTVGDLIPKAPGDSDIRLESDAPPAPDDADREVPATEEIIDLDAELRKASEGGMTLKPVSKVKKLSKVVKPSSKVKDQGKSPELPTTSPFELSESDLQLAPMDDDSSGTHADGSSEFDLELPPENADDAVELGGPPSGDSPAGRSGINLRKPSDSGISLERDSTSTDEVDFELSLDSEGTDSQPKTDPRAGSGSDSEFELSLDDEGDLTTGESATGTSEKDIFETDFELPALDEESGSQAVALSETDTDLESSDFDLALDEGDVPAEEESGSAVVALGDEEPAEGPATQARKRAAGATDSDSSSEFDLLTGDEDYGAIEREAEGEEAGEEQELVAAAPPAEWGTLPAMLMLPCVFIMILVGLMSFELLHGMWGYHQPYKTTSILVKPIAGLFAPDDANFKD